MRILLIDDDKDDQTLFYEAIRAFSSEITCSFVSDGQQALQFLNSVEQFPDLTFLDINMPIMDGKETIRLIRANPRLRHLHIVAYSTSCSQADMDWFMSMGARYLIKPNSFEALVKLLKRELLEKQSIIQHVER